MALLAFVGPVLYAIFLWWFTTGAIMAMYGRSQRAERLAFFLSSLVLIAALVALLWVRGSTGAFEAYVAFTCGVLIWGWQIVGYFLGIITGPQHLVKARMAQTRERGFLMRFRLALRANLYHELVTLAFALILVALVWDQPNTWALWAYIALWLMHLSAKLNVFLGVRNFRPDLLPRQLQYLGPLIRKQPGNALLPASVALSASVTLWLIYRAILPTAAPSESAGFLMLATMLGLGVWEHWLLVLPLPTALWGWPIRPPAEVVESSVYVSVSAPHAYSRPSVRMEDADDGDSSFHG